MTSLISTIMRMNVYKQHVRRRMTMDINLKEMGIRLRKYRLRNKLTQEELANAMGVSLSQYQKYENGECIIDTGFEAINESIDYIVRGLHSVDMLVDRALMIMPDREYKINKVQLAKYTVDIFSKAPADEYEQIKILDEFKDFEEYYIMLVNYALRHLDKIPQRICEGPHIYTLLADSWYAIL